MNIANLNHSLGIPRTELPQIDMSREEEIIELLRSNGIEVLAGTFPAAKLKPVQDQLNKEKIDAIITDGNWNVKEKILVSKEGYITDGHHRWAANVVNDSSSKMGIYLVDMNIIDLLIWLNNSSFVEHKTITEGKKRHDNSI